MKKDTSTLGSSTAVVVNDDPTQLMILSALAEKAGLGVKSFSEAEVALSEMNAENPPDIIISDLYMPKLDGWRFCRLLRSPEYPAFNSVPIIVISATFSGHEASSLTADIGANAFMSAPVDAKEFIETIQALLRGEILEETLRILIVEDSKTQARILKKAFKTVGHEAEIVETVQAAMSALGEKSYDVAVLDYHLPDGTGDTVLDTLRAQQPDCVCIMMTADSDPKLALDWMKRGSAAQLRKPFDAEYLLEVCAKARRERTLLRTEDLLEERTQQLLESERKYRDLFQDVPIGLYQTTPDGKILTVNDACLKIFRCPKSDQEEWFAKDGRDIYVNSEDCERFREIIRRDGFVEEFEAPFHRWDGTIGWHSDSAKLVYDKDGNETINGSYVDITDRKLTEEALKESEVRFRETSEMLPIVVFETNENIELTYANKRAFKLFGYSKDDYKKGLNGLDLIVPEQRELARENIAKRIKGELSAPVEYMAQSSDGSLYPILMSANPIIKEGKFVGLRGAIVDITERKRVEAELQKSSQKNHAILQAMPDFMFVLDREGTYMDYIAPHTDDLAIPREHIIGSSLKDTGFSEKECNSIISLINKALDSGEVQVYDYQLETPKGLGFYEARLAPLNDNEVLSTVRDITDRKLHEDALHESGENLRITLNSIGDAVIAADTSGKIVRINHVAEKLTGWKMEEAEGRILTDVFNIVNALTGEEVDNPVEKVLDSGKTIGLANHTMLISKDGSEYQIADSGAPITDEDGNVSGVVLVFRDVTEEYQTLKLLRDSEEKFRKYAENAPGFVTIYDCYPDGHRETLFFSSGIEKLLSGEIADRMNSDINRYFELVHPEDIDEFQKEADIAEKAGDTFDFEYRITASPEKYRWMRSIAQCVQHENGVVRWHCQIFDITEQKQAEEIRKDHVQFLESLSEIDQVIRRSVDPEQILDDVIERVLNLFECDRAWLLHPSDPDSPNYTIPIESARSEFPGAQTLDLELPVTPEIQDVMRISLAKDGPITFGPDTDNPVPSDTAKQFGVQSQMVLSIHPRKGEAWMFGMHQCTHPRVWTEHEQRLFNEIGRRVADTLSSTLFLHDLKSSQSRLLQAQKVAHIGDWSYDLIDDKATWSDESIRIMGVDPQELTMELVLSLLHPDDLPAFEVAVEESMAGKKTNELEYRIVLPDGEIRHLHNRWISKYDKNGIEIHRAGTIQDITTHVQSEEALREGELRLLSVVESTSDAIVIIDQDGNIVMWNNGAQTMFGYGAHEIIGKSVENLTPESYRRLLSRGLSQIGRAHV